jgi:hypothetical protein
MTLASVLDSRASFVVAVGLITWLAVVLLGLVAANLHVRVQRLERTEGARTGSTPYRRWLGQHWREVLGEVELGLPPRFLLVLSSSCPSCARVVRELESENWPPPTVLVWTDREPAGLAGLRETGIVLELGPEASARLDVRVTPFAFVFDHAGKVIKAAPFNDLRTIYVKTARHPDTGFPDAGRAHPQEVSP